MIGSAAAVYLLVNGRIMGASGIAGSIVDGTAGSAWGERAAFLAGVVGVPAVAALFMKMPATNVTSNVPLLIVAVFWSGLARDWDRGARRATGFAACHAYRCAASSRPSSISPRAFW